MESLAAYNFLLLSLLFSAPGAIIFLFRPDLRRVIARMALCSVPFALTERFFYPEYWAPRFLFDLADKIGFGIEDVLFVMGLGAFTSTVYAFVFRARYAPRGDFALRAAAVRALLLLALVFSLTAIIALLGIRMIYGAVGIMLGAALLICLVRRDLFLPGLLGGLLAMLLYGFLCLIFGLLLPGIFDLAWHTDRFLNIFILGIPLEELMYGFSAGAAATVFYPFAFDLRFERPHRTLGSPD